MSINRPLGQGVLPGSSIRLYCRISSGGQNNDYEVGTMLTGPPVPATLNSAHIFGILRLIRQRI